MGRKDSSILTMKDIIVETHHIIIESHAANQPEERPDECAPKEKSKKHPIAHNVV